MTGFGWRIRIVAGNIQQLREIKGLLYPLRPLALFFFLSHKLSRLLVPFAMVVALIVNLFLLQSPVYRAVLVGQLVFYALALLGMVWPLRPKLLILPYYFSIINAPTFFSFSHALPLL